MERLVVAWYAWLSSLTQGGVLALGGWADRVELPPLSAVIFGMIGAASPCQLTTNLSALAYAVARPGAERPLPLAVAYVAGKVMVYSLAGVLVWLAGHGLQAASIPVVLVARRALGPLMVVVGLGLLGLWRPRGGGGQRLALRLRERLSGTGVRGAFLLGIAFSFAVCPTLFWLFFGLTVPLALRSPGGWSFPSLFAVGASLPLLVLVVLAALGAGAAGSLAGGLGRIARPLRVGAAIVLVLAGLHDTLVYWAL